LSEKTLKIILDETAANRPPAMDKMDDPLLVGSFNDALNQYKHLLEEDYLTRFLLQ